jgi:hypothetical protein
MMAKDFRYMLDGEEVQGFQMTDAMRYQEKLWPDWMDSRYLMTVDGQSWLNVNDVETKIPDLGWIIQKADGTVTAVSYEVMERAEKVVPDVPDTPVASVTPIETAKPDIVRIDSQLVTECAMAYEMLADGQIEAGTKALRNSLSPRVAWCNCAPGQCAGGDRISCRLNSPLAK